MKYETATSVAIKKNINKTQNKIRFVGTLYLLGALALAALACLPMIELNGKALWAVNFWKPVADIFKKKFDILGIVTAVLYAILVIGCVIRFFKCFGKLGWLSKRSLKYVDGYDRNLDAMDGLGKYFSASLSAIVSISLLIWVLQAADVKVTVTMYAYAAIAFGLLLHFVAGLLAGGLAYYSRARDGKFQEEARPYSLVVYFFRNLVQIGAVVAILWFFVSNNDIGVTVAELLAKKNPFKGDLLKTVLPVGFDVLILLSLFVLIRHATNITEYNLDGIFGKGMKNYRVFAFFVTLFAGGAFVVDTLWGAKPTPMHSLIIACVAFAAFLFDCIFKSKHKQDSLRDEVLEDEEEESREGLPTVVPTPIPMQVQPQTINNYYGYMDGKTAAPQYQPIYIPVYQPWPPQLEEVEEEVEEEEEPIDPTKRWEVTCPHCKKPISVRAASKYHRCPGCQKVFQTQVKERMDVHIKK